MSYNKQNKFNKKEAEHIMIDESRTEIWERLAKKLFELELSGDEFLEEFAIAEKEDMLEIINECSLNIDIANIAFMVLGYASPTEKAPLHVSKRHLFILNDVCNIAEELNIKFNALQNSIDFKSNLKNPPLLNHTNFNLSFILFFTE